MKTQLTFFNLFIRRVPHACDPARVWEPGDSLQEAVLPSHDVGSEDQIQVASLGNKRFTC